MVKRNESPEQNEFPLPNKILDLLSKNKATVCSGVVRTVSKVGRPKNLGYLQQTSAVDSIAGFDNLELESPNEAISFLENKSDQLSVVAPNNNWSYGTLSLTSIGIGVAIFTVSKIFSKLNSIESKLNEVNKKLEFLPEIIRFDNFKILLSEINADLNNISLLPSRSDPIRVAEQLQISMSRHTRKLETHLLDLFSNFSLDQERIGEQIWNVSRLIRLCQEAAMQTLLIVDDFVVAQQYGTNEANRTFNILQKFQPHTQTLEVLECKFRMEEKSFWREIWEDEEEGESIKHIHEEYLGTYNEITIIYDGIKGGIFSLVNQVGIAKKLQEQNISGKSFIEKAQNENKLPFLFLSESDN